MKVLFGICKSDIVKVSCFVDSCGKINYFTIGFKDLFDILFVEVSENRWNVDLSSFLLVINELFQAYSLFFSLSQSRSIKLVQSISEMHLRSESNYPRTDAFMRLKSNSFPKLSQFLEILLDKGICTLT